MYRLKKTHSFLLLLALAAVWATNSALDPSNPPTAKTGAPGETTCSTSSGCHSGGNYTGTITLSGLPDTVIPNQSYPITMVHASNAVRTGFELTVLDSLNVKSGTLTAGSGSNISNAASGRQYLRQSSAKTLSNGSASYSFTWKAPLTAAGKQMTFYVASLAANGNGNKTGDIALTLAKKVILATPPSASQEPELTGVEIYPNPATEFMTIDLPEKGSVRIFNAAGAEVYRAELPEGIHPIQTQRWEAGMYVVRVQAGDRAMVRKISKN